MKSSSGIGDLTRYFWLPVLCLATLHHPTPALAWQALSDPGQLVKEALEHWRGETSIAKAEMTVQRPSWQRTSSVEITTKGRKQSLVRFTAPAKDAGNASLTVDQEMWSFSPRINKTIKIPPSMRQQSWMGSDFSYEDLSKGDSIIDDYTHSDIGREEHDGKPVVVIESTPKENAPVVWGKEILRIREDKVIVGHQFFDQDGKLVKELRALEIRPIGGKVYATRMRMENKENPNEWTEIETKDAVFGIELNDRLFTLSNLSSPR